ncbi:TetR/AcrR family transcriptional regulator [Sphingobium sp. HBC34]|uniref:TetR/AcrR family transcriptional regulator n=1 Tax=Sphingobium cyanobacteriorum TaxID=3063954 RepID=A0ABT8ZK16_9SPHN|nr:TetR/AcrR family transcriptional regulator [Sphingobium sp. HBC34]MDO7834561.1 TetR/AcrR family transcriptional regulator [Sphingobium sp. HBC34]
MTKPECTPIPSKREARRQDRRDMILTVAQGYFLAHGYAGTSMSGIAAELGGSKGTLWSHFRSKEELFAASLERVANAYRAELSQILDPCGALEPTLHRACQSLIEKMTSPDAIAFHRLIISEGRRFPELAQIFFDLAPKNTRLLLADFLDGAMTRGQLRRTDPVAAARALMALVMAGSHHQMLMGQIDQPDPAHIRDDVDFAMDLFLRAYAIRDMDEPARPVVS